jgi:CRISPR-associated protein Csm3
MKLVKYVSISATLRCQTGLRIGGSKEDIEIGGLDSPIIRDPLTRLPYIPGSSLKGKLRSLLEYTEGKVSETGDPHSCRDKNCLICKVFGPHNAQDRVVGPTRIIVRDALINDVSAKKLKEKLETGSLYTETKQEVSINRKTGTASAAGPRTMERVPAGTDFDLHIVLRIFDGDNADEFIAFVEKGLTNLGSDYLGGSGTRGYGWVEVRDLKWTDC